MLNRTPETFTRGQKIFHLECRFGDSEPELKKLFVVGNFLHEGHLMVRASIYEENNGRVVTETQSSLRSVLLYPKWQHHEYTSGVISFSVRNPFFLTEKEVATLADIGKESNGVGKLLSFLPTEQNNGEDNLEVANSIGGWVWYWKDLHHKTQT